ncbi:MAG: DoxX family protein [Bacteroidota bacterium]
MKSLGYLGKLLFAGPMAMFGVFHFMGASTMTRIVPSYIPFPIVWVYATGLAFILAAVAIIIGQKARLATQLLGVMLVAFAVLVHLEGFLGGNPASSANFLKDIALGGAAWFMSSYLHN